jgi:hypothetical protein
MAQIGIMHDECTNTLGGEGVGIIKMCMIFVLDYPA